jgi:hypothetical protein
MKRLFLTPALGIETAITTEYAENSFTTEQKKEGKMGKKGKNTRTRGEERGRLL